MKKVKIISGKDGRIGMSFDGFVGDECYKEAERIKASLKKLGIEIKTELIEPKNSSLPESVEGIKNEQKR